MEMQSEAAVLDAHVVETEQITPNGSLTYRFCKRALDIIVSLFGLVILSPIFLITAIAIFVDDPGPVLFFQDRDGLNGKIFKMWKFRSMYQNAPELRARMEAQNELDGPVFKMVHDPRVTKVGRFIRRTSIDELPQLINILCGEMSFVGPRPLPTYETAQLTKYQRQRLLVKPGLTCYWQVSGRSDIPFNEWMELDLKYIQEEGFGTDIKILLRTPIAVVRGRGAY